MLSQQVDQLKFQNYQPNNMDMDMPSRDTTYTQEIIDYGRAK